MKTYNTFGIAVAALAALVCTFAVTATAADGDIWSIRRAAGGDHGTETLSMSDNPVTAGQKVKFKFRLLNRDPQANYIEKGGAASATTWDNRWYFKYVGAGGTNEAASAASLYPPKVGVWVSGRYQWADVESLAPVSYVSGGSEVVNYDFTDLICSYTAQPGDFGLLTLAAGSESAPVEASDNDASTYCLKNSSYWGIYDKLTTTNACNLWFTGQSQGAISSYVTFPTDDDPKFVQDRDLSQAGIYIRTIDFDDYKFNDDVWRRIAANGTSSYVNNGNAKRAPTLSIPGSVATDHTVTLYAWVEDETVAYMKDGVDYDFGGGVTRKVVHIPIAPADGEIKEIPGGIFAMGDATNKTTKIFLSATPTNIFRTGVMITNFVTKTVLVGPPEPPSIVVKPGGASDWTAVAGSPAEIVPITVELEGVASYTSDLEVTVTAEMINSSADWKDFIGLSSLASGDPNGTSATVKISAGTQSNFAYVYVKRASEETSASTKGISIKAEITDPSAIAYFSGGIIAGTLHIQPSKPKITYPATDTVYYDVPAGEEFEMSFNVADAEGELSGKYTLEYTLTGIWSSMNTKTIDVGVPNGTDNTLTTNLIFNTTSSNALFRVRNQDGYVSDPIHLTINVFAKPLIGATPYNHVGTDGNPSRTYNEGELAKLTFTLGTPFALADVGYIFLVPQTEASSNLVETTAFEQGIRILRDQTATTLQASLLLLDGAANTELRYEFEIWNTLTKTEAGAMRIGTGTDGYASGEIALYVENVTPTVEGVSMSDTPLYTNGGTMEAKAAKDVTKIFRIESVNEPSDKIDLTNELFMTEWKFYEGGSVLFTTNIYGNPYLAEVPYAFHNSGTNKVTVKVKDKDMTEQQFKQSAAFTFFVETLDEPTISMMPYNGSFYFVEEQVGSIDGRVDVKLNIAPTETIEVEIKVVHDGAPDGLTSDPVLSTNLLTFTSGTTSRYFYFKELDGDANFIVSARVITGTQSVDPNKTWAEYYRLEEDGGYPMTVENSAPMIQGMADTNAVPAGLNVPAKSISWSAKDVLPDIREGMEATLTVEGDTFAIPITTTNASGSVYGEIRGSYSPTFTSAGLKTVTLVVSDKNGKSDTRRYYYIVEPSKELYLHPIGPRRGGISPLSIRYFSSGDLGSGRVWADAGADPTISEFDQKWTYDPGVGSANVFAYGYRKGEEATGALLPGKDFRLDVPGYVTTGSDLYKADPILDSFFYCWILETKAEDGNWTGDYLGAIQPSVGTNTTGTTAKQVVGLPEYDSEAVVYEERHVTAIFSKEKYPEDNVGDINQDDIPDVYAAFVTWDGGSSDAGGGGGGRLFEVAGNDNDLKSLRNFNGDNDYLPSKTSAGGTLIPNISSQWATYGAPFTAYLELRGYGEGLNYRANTLSGRGRNSGGTWISERDFTEAESNAWDTVYNLDPDWTPENRTDPTVDDTDDDGLPDGYEYYIWYHAYVGWMEDGKLKRLEGSKFQLEDIAVGKKISPEDVAKAFNPNEYASNVDERDTDNDGLTDLEEFAIGTNPVHWDTDGDGISDYWEVMRGLNPLVAESDSTNPNTNPDNDYMAWAEVGKDYALITLPDGRMFAVANNGKGLVDSSGTTPTIIEAGTNTVAAIPVYRYGNASSTLVPKNRGAWEGVAKSGMKGSAFATFQEYTCTSKPLDASLIDWGDGIDLSNVVIKLDQKLTLVHEQVRAQYGFDPRTAWGMNVNGCVCNRWDPNMNPVLAQRAGTSGRAVNTKAYSNLDEYLLLKYRYMTTGGSPGMDLSRNLSKDLSDWKADGPSGIGKIFKEGTTNPNVRYSNKTYGDYGSSGSDGSASLTAFSDKTHGADTDSDGVPDGWELYVGFNPNYKKDGALEVDGDTLALAREFAGTDSCNAYSNAVSLVAETDSDAETETATIYKNHPGNVSGWFNKFFPTDPWNGDTDGDNVRDDTEGGSWEGSPVLNNAMRVTTEVGSYSFSFVYGSPEDDGSLCIRGGGMNPCSVDTDFDLLPDPWEMCHAGVRAEGGKLLDGDFDDSVTLLCSRNDGNPTGSLGVYITAGMDATLGPREDNKTQTGDAYTNPSFTDPRTGTIRNFDFDGDGLQNFQEYLVQALRHLRYDDCETPLMGSWMPDGSTASRTFLGFIPMNYMDGETFYAQTKGAGFVGGGAWQFRELGYFARPPHEWDPIACIPRSNSNYGDSTGYRIMLPPHGLSGSGRLNPIGYASSDPRLWDSDYDNMDDYYELFHGLNPLLGSIANTTPEGMPDMTGDVIARAYAGTICFWRNAWTGWPMMPQDWLSGEVAYRDIDAVKYPWMIGTPEADADGDGIRNGEEALVVNLTSPQPTHTDPTPLWLTDSTARNKASYTSQYYMLDEEILLFYPWPWTASGQTGDGSYTSFLFSFEENEGYDTDGDWVADSDEQKLSVTPISDPLKFTDPDRRQALWFPGENSAAVSRTADYRRLNYAAYDLLRQFTVEAWICPNDTNDQVILERVAVYGASTMSNNVAKLRANFRLGIRDGGRLYGLFDTSDAVTSGTGAGTATVVGSRLETNAWTHVALSYNGRQLALYINGILANSLETTLIPANGLINFVEDAVPNMSNFPVLNYGYTSVPSAIVLGAQALDYNGIALSDKSAWTSYAKFYAGYIDEVRVWDGVRKGTEIAEDYKKRYTFEDVSAIRDKVYAAWASGATRNDNDGNANLPAELIAHYNFQTLPGATDSKYVAWEPSGFTKNVRNLGKVEGNNVPGDIYCGWWYATPVHSTVYSNQRLVPWIQNTVSHLPLMDGSTVDSQFWSEYSGGMTVAGELNGGIDKILFPNTANPYPYYIFTTDRRFHEFKLQQMCQKDNLAILPQDVQSKYAFELRTTIIGSSDLVPLGGAFAKRGTSMWDNSGPMTAWEQTGRDLNANGIPDWWEKEVVSNYTNANGITEETIKAGLAANDMDTRVFWDGREMSVREAYLRDLRHGMLQTASVDDQFAISAENFADSDNDGIPDWWRNLTGLNGGAADDDDNDGLPNFVEYQISEVYTNESWQPSPVKAYTYSTELGQVVPDYFLRFEWEPGISNYLGFAHADHDFIENAWEDKFNPSYISRAIYDAWKDADDDGWSNFAEARAGSNPSRQNEVGVDGYVIAGHPVPDIALSLNNADGSVFSPGQTIRVQAYHDGKLEDIPSAQWTVSANETQSRFLGINTGKKVKFTLGPGAIKQGSINLRFKAPVWWTRKTTYKNGIVVDRSSTYNTMSDWRDAAHDTPFSSEPTKGGLYWTSSTGDDTIGTVDYVTGEVEFDFALCSVGTRTIAGDETTTAENGDITRVETIFEYPSDQAWFLIEWGSMMASGNTRQTLRLSEPELAMLGVSDGMLREGKNTFVAFVDKDGSGTYTIGEPYGVATGVDVSWFGTSVSIELSRTAPQMTRTMLSGSGDTRVRVVRGLLNGEPMGEGVLIDRKIDVSKHPLLTEADLLATGELDLDWGTLATAWLDAGNANVAGLTNATYSVLTGDGATSMTDFNGEFSGLNGTLFNIDFEAGSQQSLAEPMEPAGGRIYSASPTFRWKHENSISKSYPAFRLRVWGADDGALVFDSGVMRAPARDVNGVYEWTAPIYAGMVTPQGAVFESGKAYRWTVSMLDAKFTEPNRAETKNDFTLACTGDIRDAYGYGSIDVRVKYFGPLAEKLQTDVTLFTNLVRVQAFESPDFTGAPVGEAFVTNVADIADISSLTVNATILGLKPGSYYIRAFIDTDADCSWSQWESWGYANYFGTDESFVYTPRAVAVAQGAVVPAVTVYIEDADTNNNAEPDAWEMDERGTLGASAIKIKAGGVLELPEDGGALLDPPQGLNELTMTLKPAPLSGKPVTLELTLESLTGDTNNLPTFVAKDMELHDMSTNEAGVVTAYITGVTNTEVSVCLTNLDGTAFSSYLITATATNAVDRYRTGEFRFSVTNIAPVIAFSGSVTNDCPTNAVWKAIGSEFDISMTVDDVAADLAAGLNVYWQGEGLFSTNAAVVTTNDMIAVTNGVTLVTNKVDMTFKLVFMEGGTGLRKATIVAEDKDGGVSTRDFWYYVVAPRDDFDNDGLSNWWEWKLEGCLHDNHGFRATSYTNQVTKVAESPNQDVPDYFLKKGVSYLGFMCTDHDFMEDWWEDLFDPDYVSRFTFDAWDDPDDDGWSNFAEARAGTDPTKRSTMILDAESLMESPTPTIRLKVTYYSRGNAQLSAPLVVKAYSENYSQEASEAVWNVPVSDAQSFSMSLGANPGEIKTFNVGPGSIVPGTISIEFRDPNTFSHTADGGGVWLHPSETPWQVGVIEYIGAGQMDSALLRRGSHGGDVGSVSYETGQVTLDFSKLQDHLYFDSTENVYKYSEPSVSNDWIRLDLSKSFVRIRWDGKVASYGGRVWETTLAAPNVKGRLTEGKTLFEVFADADGDGAWTPGEPYGIVKDVDVGWAVASAEVEMTDVNPSILRINMSDAIANNTFEAQKTLSDRGVWLSGDWKNKPIPAGQEGTNMPNATSSDVVLRFVRTSVNGVAKRTVNTTVYYASRLVMDIDKNLAANPLVTERDLLQTGNWDFDWNGFNDTTYLSNLNLSKSAITSVVYKVVVGDGSISAIATNNNLATCFVNRFEYGTTQSGTTPVSPNGHIYSQPTFKWKHVNTIDKDYPAFQLRVYEADSGAVIYDSGVQKAPPRSQNGDYSWTAPIYPEMMLPSGKVFSNTNNYTWSVSMLDAKFTTFNANETKMHFRMDASGHLDQIDDYGMIRARVRYFGKTPTASNAIKNLVRVQAFTTPDFSGMPAGEAYVKDLSQLSSESAINVNAVILGLKPGTYYLRAYIDTDGNGVWDRWESWGYGNYVHTYNPALYTPRGYEIRMNYSMPEAEIYLEDMDTDKDGFADSLEMTAQGSLTAINSPPGSTFFTKVNPNFEGGLSPLDFGDSANSPVYSPITLMSAIAAGIVDDEPVAEGDVTVRIDGFSLSDGLDLTVMSDVTEVSTRAKTVMTFSSTADVNVVLVAAKKPDFSDATEIVVDTLTLSAQGTTAMKVTAEKIRAAIDAAGLGDAAFFKVKLEQ